MTDRISLPQLRQAATREKPPLILTDQEKLLALVDAVEAAHELATHLEACNECDGGDHVADSSRFKDAFARFDFPERRGSHE